MSAQIMREDVNSLELYSIPPRPPNGATAPNVPEFPHYRGFTITVGRTPLDE